MKEFLNNYQSLIQIIIICSTSLMLLIIVVKNKLNTAIDFKNKKINIQSDNKVHFEKDIIVMHLDAYDNKKSKIKNLAYTIANEKNNTLQSQMMYVERKLSIFFSELLNFFPEMLNIEKESDAYVFYELLYSKAQEIIINELRKIIKKNHLSKYNVKNELLTLQEIKSIQDDWHIKKSEINDFIYDEIEKFIDTKYRQSIIGYTRKDFLKIMKTKIFNTQKKCLNEILDHAKTISILYEKNVQQYEDLLQKI